jgi:mono/diheme cytochrome c family protein
MAPRAMIAACLVTAATLTAGCGSQTIDLSKDDPNHTGAKIFVERCGGCHTLSKAGTQGSTFDVSDRESVDGPNFDDRKETVDDVVFAIENGGFSGAIMPENIVTGQEAREVAQFLAKYAGKGDTGDDTDKLGAPGPESVGG